MTWLIAGIYTATAIALLCVVVLAVTIFRRPRVEEPQPKPVFKTTRKGN